MAFRRNGHLEGVTKILQKQLVSVSWLGTGFMSGAELVKEVFQSGALTCAGLLPQVFKKRHPFHLHYTHVRAFMRWWLLRNLSCATRAMSARNCLQVTA